MVVGKLETKRFEKLRIWRPGAASRAGDQRALREIPGAGGGGASGFQVFRFSERADAQIFRPGVS
jgi:hypothetical protein